MRRFLVLCVIFLIPLQFLDEAFDELIGVASAAGVPALTSAINPPSSATCMAAKQASDSDSLSASSLAHADLADVVVAPLQMVSSQGTFQLAPLGRQRALPQRIFPIYNPPR